MSSLIASGASDVTQVSVSARTASLLSAMTSWITAALLTTERALGRPQTKPQPLDPGWTRRLRARAVAPRVRPAVSGESVA